MKRKLAITAVALLLVLVVTALCVYQATQSVPEFYELALAADPVEQKYASNEMFNRSTRLIQDVKKQKRWQASFTAEQINGFLAVDLQKKFPRMLPGEIRDPRVAIREDGLSLGCRYDNGSIETVLSVNMQVYLSAPDVVAVRIESARAGSLPLPLSKVLDSISAAARAAKWNVVWKQEDGDPVALLTVPPPRDASDQPITLESIELGEGEVYVAGSTGDAASVANQSGLSVKRQR